MKSHFAIVLHHEVLLVLSMSTDEDQRHLSLYLVEDREGRHAYSMVAVQGVGPSGSLEACETRDFVRKERLDS